MIILDGKKVSKDIKDSLKKEVEEIICQNKRAPHLAIVLVGLWPVILHISINLFAN